jgi:simple sugar transport system substrate-binding protein
MKRLLILLLAFAGCGGTEVVREPAVQVSGTPSATPAPGAPLPDDAVRIAVVTHGPASSKFWAIIRNGVDSAARRLDVLVDYQSPDVFSVERMSELVDRAVATKPDGLVVSIPSDGLAPAIRRAVKARIPVVSINSGSDVFKRLGVLVHVGQLEDRAGLEAGRRLADAGVRSALCLNHETDNAGVDARCAGLVQAMREAGGRARTLRIDDEDPRLPAKLAATVSRERVDGVLATNSLGGLAAAKGLAGTGVKIGTFDLGPDVLKAVEAGRIGFAVDQQPYLQGYLPIEMLAMRARYGILPAQHDVVATGPNFVTRENAPLALELSEQSIR